MTDKVIGVCYKCGGDATLLHHQVYDEETLEGNVTVSMCRSCHQKLHFTLRKEGKCKIPVDELRKIHKKCVSMTPKVRKQMREYMREYKKYNQNYKEEKKQYDKEYYQNHKEEKKQLSKIYRLKNVSKLKEYRQNHKEETALYNCRTQYVNKNGV